MSGATAPAADNQIALPFIVVNTKKETVIDCEMAEDKQVRCHQPNRLSLYVVE